MRVSVSRNADTSDGQYYLAFVHQAAKTPKNVVILSSGAFPSQMSQINSFRTNASRLICGKHEDLGIESKAGYQ